MDAYKLSDLNQQKVNHKTMNSYSGTNIAMGNEPNPVLCSVSAIFKKGRVNSVKTILELHGGSGEIQWNFTVEKFLLSNFLWSHTPLFGHILWCI